MDKKRRCTACVQCLVLLLTALFLNGCSNDMKNIEISLFSWKEDTLGEQQENLFQIMDSKNVSVLYQAFPGGLKQSVLNTFFDNAQKHDIEIYYLTGDPKWSLDETGMDLCRKVGDAAEINRCLPEGRGLKGIIFDVEPYLLDNWEDDNKDIMQSFVSGMRAAYTSAARHGLRVIVCIPYYYENDGLEEQLESLISSCCDAVAVMNYYRGKEIEHISTEAAIAKKYEKELINIYELKPPGKHGLVEKNTYFGQGLDAVEENFQQLRDAYSGLKVSMAYHDYNSLKEEAENE